jgi:hypothetical protein
VRTPLYVLRDRVAGASLEPGAKLDAARVIASLLRPIVVRLEVPPLEVVVRLKRALAREFLLRRLDTHTRTRTTIDGTSRTHAHKSRSGFKSDVDYTKTIDFSVYPHSPRTSNGDVDLRAATTAGLEGPLISADTRHHGSQRRHEAHHTQQLVYLRPGRADAARRTEQQVRETPSRTPHHSTQRISSRARGVSRRLHAHRNAQPHTHII